MKCTTPEISWHNRDPVLSVDIQSDLCVNLKGEKFWRVATGGADGHVLIWHLTTTPCGGATVTFAADLERHQKAVNIVRFSPSKEILASGDDESAIILWRMKDERENSPPSDSTENREQWTSWKVLRGHIEDIYDISWSPDSNHLISGSVDNTAIMWDVQKGRKTAILSDHKGFVQGVSWDPCNQYVCTISTDRQCRLTSIATKKVVQRVYKSKIPTSAGSPLEGKIVRLFYDDTFKSFFRRLTFSIDGSLILVPSGIIESQETTETISNATIVFSRQNMKEPIMILPTLSECTIAVRCCPVYFELREDGPDALITLPYRMVFAVATQSSILIYDTQQIFPIGMVSLIHYGRLNDLSWSSDGRILIVSSSDGYCSVIHFEENELGKIYKATDSASTIQTTSRIKNPGKRSSSNGVKDITFRNNNVSTFDVDDSAMDIDLAECDTIEMANDRSEELNERRSDKVESGRSIITSKIADLKIDKKSIEEEETEDIKLVYEESTSDTCKTKTKDSPLKTDVAPTISNNKTPRRVKLITLSSPREVKKQ
ncbi:hypothetical protein DMN91_002477 [Ooceraea biroi]|uniref:Chromatin assembly factor 1 subunit B n=1 Tax=Ooceraea biroi TaxID=2015173 RepID=A0A026WMU4_OOCBI|nr:chromatin assembly factor 1 subunit B [Ooceraea biroi]EZA57248.1 Chromatin assembly factor 1 subunit B [Ooceraea biroi]RLU24388.1 hypothetical protein DMN91_002477 [Ooceraea biroi]